MAGESLRVVSGNAGGTEISLDEEFEIGRAADGDGTLGDDPEISRRHARITRRAGDQLTIEDLGSTNGTFVNGKRIEAPTPLTPGDTLKMGTTTLQVLDAQGKALQATALGTTQPDPDEGATKAASTVPTPAPPAPKPAAPAPPVPSAPVARSPQAAPPPGGGGQPPLAPPRPQPARSGGGGGGRTALLAGLGLLIVAGVVVGVLALTGGDDKGEDENKVLNTREIIDANRASTVRINTRGPARDDNDNRIVVNGGGTGIVFNAARGLVLTNAHVVAGQSSIKVTVGGSEVNAVVRGRAPCEDLAVLELRPKPSGLKQAELGRARGVRAGDKVTALGFPGAFEEETTERRLQATDGTVSSGVTSASIGDTLPKFPALIQHQAPISPGNSGGPLFNDRGEVVGINTLASTGEGGRQNQNGAISIDRARSLLKDLTANRSSGYVGWNVVPIKTDGGTEFLFITGVDPNSPAERANLAFGDAVLEIDDTKVGSVAEACDIIGSKSSGDRLKVSGLSVPTRRFFIVRARLR